MPSVDIVCGHPAPRHPVTRCFQMRPSTAPATPGECGRSQLPQYHSLPL